MQMKRFNYAMIGVFALALIATIVSSLKVAMGF